uniref:non-specific serine/threonine protein kinase n=1 Tax=Angiostrongylus cantonensis TaxID=6313 RepID=A0A158P8V5_ANGCA
MNLKGFQYCYNVVLSQPRSLKVCKPYSRVYPHGFPVSRPRQVSRNGIPSDNIERASAIYTYDKERSYFEQCFKELRVLGRGLFGETELCGPNLAEYRYELGVLEEQELWKVLFDMVKALHHMHSSGMLHMDVKPSNIFISKNSTCKLGDFGLAFDMNETPIDTAEEGDKYYMAPEILNNSPTTAADVYSLGVSMLELATTIDVREQCDKIRSGELADSFFAGKRNDLHELILSLIHPDPINRPTTSQLMEDEILMANNQKPVYFREIQRNQEVKLQTGPLDKDWDFEFEDEIHPPSLRFSKSRLPLRDTHSGDIWKTAESVRTCLRFEDSNDDDSPSSISAKWVG